MSEGSIVEGLSGVVQELTFKDRFWNTLKKLIIIFAIFILIFKFLVWFLNNVRKSWQLQLADNTWRTIIWIKFWNIVIGVLLYYYGIFDIAYDWILGIYDWIIAFGII